MRAPDTTTRQTSKAEESVTALVDRARDGDREAFADLYVRYRPQIYTYLLRRTHDRPLSEDLTGDVFVRALARISAFTWRGSDFGAWLATIARNRLLDHYKSARHQRETPTSDMHDHDVAVEDIGEQVSDDLTRTSVLAELRTALAGLTPGQRECLWLRYWHDLSFREIGERMNRSTNAAKVLKERALQNLSTPENRAALSQAASDSGTRSPAQSCTAPQALPRVPSPRRPAPSHPLDSGRTRPMPAPLPALTASQAVALVLLRDGLTERTITLRTGTVGTTLYTLAAAHGVTAPHGTVEGHRCHEATGDEPCDGCSLADARDQARNRARHRRSVSSLPRTLRRQATGRRNTPQRTPRPRPRTTDPLAEAR
ncbi:RNA polymerase sigma factor [Streptomyces melanogenes]|uniref:RNA polymerase sigma factor n=1 Tax=Streptomyces melanogenes TaxID=67326 RepID=UPI00167E68E2|nr:sigma-70 family RNA polymerase sigma factor [Streptomyces melanogenes]GGP80482.1 ecf family sigma factor [Streptomyces melanogenes]